MLSPVNAGQFQKKYNMRLKYFDYKQNVPEFPQLETIEVDEKRFYKTPNGIIVPSVTTVLSHFEQSGIEKWKKSIGEEEANRISKFAASRGETFHQMIEKYLSNDENFSKNLHPISKGMFLAIRESLNSIGTIHHLETQLYSEKLKIAGRVDLIADYNDKLSIIDFKTSKKFKKEKWIQKYFEQASAYSLLYQDLTGIEIKQIVILIYVDHEPDPQIFVRKRSDYINSLLDKIVEYRKKEQANVS